MGSAFGFPKSVVPTKSNGVFQPPPQWGSRGAEFVDRSSSSSSDDESDRESFSRLDQPPRKRNSLLVLRKMNETNRELRKLETELQVNRLESMRPHHLNITVSPATRDPVLSIRQASDASERIEWKRGQLLGTGSFGQVYLGLLTKTGELMAVKQIRITSTNDIQQNRIINNIKSEIRVMQTLDCKHIVAYLGCQTSLNEPGLDIFLEYVPGGSIASLLNKFGHFSETLTRLYIRQTLTGLAYLHEHGHVHRDIKCANLLVDPNGVVKLADFGASVSVQSLRKSPSLRGTPYFMAPELIRLQNPGPPIDVWSIGCTVIEMLSGRPPWSDIKEPAAVLFHIASSGVQPPLPDFLSDESRDFILQCMRQSPEARPTAAELLSHPFLALRGDEISEVARAMRPDSPSSLSRNFPQPQRPILFIPS